MYMPQPLYPSFFPAIDYVDRILPERAWRSRAGGSVLRKKRLIKKHARGQKRDFKRIMAWRGPDFHDLLDTMALARTLLGIHYPIEVRSPVSFAEMIKVRESVAATGDMTIHTLPKWFVSTMPS